MQEKELIEKFKQSQFIIREGDINYLITKSKPKFELSIPKNKKEKLKCVLNKKPHTYRDLDDLYNILRLSGVFS